MPAVKAVKAVWGCLWLANGAVIQLDGEQYKQYTNIEQFGQQDLGSEANVYVEYTDGTNALLETLADVQTFFAQ